MATSVQPTTTFHFNDMQALLPEGRKGEDLLSESILLVNEARTAQEWTR